MKGFDLSQQDGGPIDPGRTALLGIHWQTDLIDPKGAFGPIFADAVAASGVVQRTSALFQQARRAGCRIIFANIVYRPGYTGHVANNTLFRQASRTQGFVEGTPGAGVDPAFGPEPGDIVMAHSRSSAFFGSDLLSILVGGNIQALVLTGIATNVAVDHTARDAMQYGFRTVLVEDCCLSSDPDLHRASLATMRVLCSDVLTSEAFVQLIEAS